MLKFTTNPQNAGDKKLFKSNVYNSVFLKKLGIHI